jgi:SAM-dependent methyltransferase
MEPAVAEQLLALNHQFYQTFAGQFSATRQRLQPGVQRILASLPPTVDLLDLGCGNGALARALAARGHTGRYLGLDFSPSLLSFGQAAALPANFQFQAADLGAPHWAQALPAVAGQPPACPYVLCFATLHHLPGQAQRARLLDQVHALLAPGGRLIHSNWQFLHSPRLSARLQPWEAVGLTAAAVEPGDYLLDWRSGGRGLRYVHHFSVAELAELAAATGFRVVESFLSDGASGDLGLYQTWEKQA